MTPKDDKIDRIESKIDDLSGYIRGVLPSLATKDYVKEEVVRGQSRFDMKIIVAVIVALVTCVASAVASLVGI